MRTLIDIVERTAQPAPWTEGDNIPWSDPEFSKRMLTEHLSQDHDLASRRTETIDGHVDWIFSSVLGGHPGRVLDLGCGPGLYAHRLARRGCDCVGVDFSPASILSSNQFSLGGNGHGDASVKAQSGFLARLKSMMVWPVESANWMSRNRPAG
jgi:SAM-dependent methyltransferase